jgi:hypothetical protein
MTSAEILYGNVLTFDFCCISRCSGEMLLTEASPCFSAFIHVICLGHYLFALVYIVIAGPNLTMIQP